MSLPLHQLACSSLQIPRSCNKSLVFPKFANKSGADPKRMLETRPRAASVGGSGAEYSEQLLGTERKRKTPSVAGVDQDELLDPVSLADPDSFFCEFKGVQIHHKICNEEEPMDYSFQNQTSSQLSNRILKIGFPIILLHGFGASVFSWNQVMKPLAQIAGTKVLAFDRPAFGLTSRVSSFEHRSSDGEDAVALNPYSMAFSALATLFFIDFLAAKKAILMGHSAGCLVAVDAYFEAPERVAALILVAPAILAPRVSRTVSRENQTTREDQIVDGSSISDVQENPFVRIVKTISKFFMYIVRATMQMMKTMMDMVSSLYQKALSAILRSAFAVMLVRTIMDKFGRLAVRNAFYDVNRATDHVLHGYTKPLRVKHWDKALLEYTLAMLTDSSSKSKSPLSKRLAEISCPVLIITGDYDRIVPSWNAKRLSQAIPGSCFEVIKNCGHLPHEERVEEFLSVVDRFLQRVFGAPEEQLLQATA
ncbi:uncharacterized protein LOC131253686 [Magnolia sinica]|uniref:uncharacterized protein LOC131253686 n=1 Tax=Magnolia sinica TaxID=86752 RepID=UPI00265AFCF7|nr:uncharacterized protein LOC131253686 [Magnolia sinica]XP_058110786.1 uncharacterized protein LOC131253686 [Magnolia sinica]